MEVNGSRHVKNREREVVKSRPYFEVFKESIKSVAREYCENSTICGLKHLVDDEHRSFERSMWSVILIGALVVSIVLVYITFQKFYTSPLVTIQSPDGISVAEIVFPAVSLCSTNRISKKKVTQLARELIAKEHNSKYNEVQMLGLLKGLGQFYEYQPQSKNLTHKLTELHKALGKYDVNELLKNLTPSCEDLLLKCSWDGRNYSCEKLFEFRLTMNGYCCAFNYLRDTSDKFDDYPLDPNKVTLGNKTGYNEELGLKALVKFTTEDDFYHNIPIRGTQLQFTDAHDFPDAPSGSYATHFLDPAVEMTVLVNSQYTEASRDIQHIPISVRKCVFFDESPYLKFYTHSDCMLKCRMLYLLERCNCTQFNMLKMNDVKTCDLLDLNCLKINHASDPYVNPNDPESEKADGISCPMCYPTCSKNSYNFEFSNTMINSEKLNRIPNAYRPKWLVGADFTSASIVNVRHGNMFASLYGQNVIMKWFDLFSNIGSTCGFVTGFSFVSAAEFIYFFTIKLLRNIRARQSLPRGQLIQTPESLSVVQISTKTEVKGIEPPPSEARYRPLYWNEVTRSIHPRMYSFNMDIKDRPSTVVPIERVD